jgi:hypothetical protein
LTLLAPQRAAFAELNLVVALTVMDAKQQIVLSPEPDVNAHLKRMRHAGEALAPKAEWQCKYSWGDAEVESRVVPFIRDGSPLPQEALECTTSAPLHEGSYDIEVQCIECPESPELQAQLQLSSSWK